MLTISPHGFKKANQAILITGSARSGTTIMGKLLHTLEHVEYIFEPPLLFSLFALIDKMPEEQWRLLYETYLYEEYFINALSGRTLNCNRHDDSSIYRVKSEEEISSRLNKSMGKLEAETLLDKHTVAYKIPDIVFRVPQMITYYPGTKVICMNRGYIETLNSLYNKKWFTDENSKKNLIWPFTVYKNIQIPFWVAEKDYDDWVEMSALDRCAYYYIQVTKNIGAIKNRIDIHYHDLLSNTVSTMEKLADTLNLAFGPKTKDVIDTVQPTQPNRDPDILGRLSPSLKTKILSLSEENEHIYA